MTPVTQTLFVDESGDFSAGRRSVISGILCAGEPEAAEQRLAAALAPVRRRFRIRTIADLHLTVLRQRRGNAEATLIARAVLDAAWGSGILTGMLAVENLRGEGLRDSERTYRLMLLDLLALADAALPEDRQDASLQVIVARRRLRDGTPMSTREDLLADVVLRIEDAVEVGLAARGLLVRLDARQVRICPAARSAGLAVADFIANLAYNRHWPESGALFNALVKQDRLRLFEGLGGYAERRARIAERDGDLTVSLARWALLDGGTQIDSDRAAALVRLWRRVLGWGTTGPMATLEAVLERLWRTHRAPQDHPRLAAALVRMASALQQAGGPPALRYRLHNLMHQVANQMGDLPTAERMLAAQSILAPRLAADPSLFHLILDAQVFRTLTEELRLDLPAVLHHARAHARLVEQYGTVWELLDRGSADRAQSRLWLRARMTLVRALLLAGEPERLKEAQLLLTGINADRLGAADRSRLDSYRVWLAVREDRPDEALDLACVALERHDNLFVAQFAARAAADLALREQGQARDRLRDLLPQLRRHASGTAGHPGEVLWRDLGVLEQCMGGDRAAVCTALGHSMAISDALPDSPVKVWNRLVIEVHRAELCGAAVPTRVLPTAVADLERRAREAARGLGRLRAYRCVSPW